MTAEILEIVALLEEFPEGLLVGKTIQLSGLKRIQTSMKLLVVLLEKEVN